MIGYLLGTSATFPFSTIFWAHVIFFLIPANIYLYGLNDLADQDTDKYNTKKGTKEHSLLISEVPTIQKLVLLSLACSLPLLFTYQNIQSTLILFLFLFLSYAYSFPPWRLKARPYFDFSTNCLYILPGTLAYFQTTESLPSLPIATGLFFWTSAMHLFSAVPDIAADRSAGVTTTAVKYGFRTSLIFCTVFWFISSLLLGLTSNIFVLLALLSYPILALFAIFQGPTRISQIYWYFPYQNISLGLIYFIYLYLT
jgi:4-hydroxybenzoate polyprenyltransferase